MSGDHLDPETLALWVDDELSAGDRAAAERHVADCARCQAALAALIRIVPARERSQPWWRVSRIAWLVPVSAAAAALAIWIAVPGTPPTRSAGESTPASAGSTPGSAPAVSAPEPAKQEAQNVPAAPPKTQVVERRDEQEPPVEKRTAPQEETRQQPQQTPAPASQIAAAPPPSAAPTPAAPAAAAAAVRAFSGAAADSTAKSASRANVIAPQIVSPDSMSRWRITSGVVVEHSTDGGATWQGQPTGTTSMLTAGSAPSPSVCWVVGQDGVVLLSTDAQTWRRVDFPTTTALASIRATDERNATVTDVNGRTYVTSDGGVQWRETR